MKLILLFSFVSLFSFSQKMLRFNYHSILGKDKFFEFFPNQEFSCRLKGELFNHKHKIRNMNDSLLIFDKDQIVRLDNIKGIRIKGFNFSRYLYGSAFVFLFLDTANNLIYQRGIIVNERAVYVSAIFLVSGLIINYFRYPEKEKQKQIRKDIC